MLLGGWVGELVHGWVVRLMGGMERERERGRE